MDFFNGNNLRKLNRLYNEFLSEDSYKHTRVAVIRHKRFEQVDIASSERNGVSSVMQVVDQIIECRSVYWLTGTGSPSLYIRASANTSHSFGAKQRVLIVYKTPSGKKTIELFRSWDREDFKAADYMLSFEHVEKLQGKSWDIQNRYKKRVVKEYTDLLYSSMHNLERGNVPEDLDALGKKFGVQIVEAVPFTHRYNMFRVAGVKSNALNLKLAIKNVSTYCTLPETLELTFKKKDLDLVRLSELNIETAGYYDHSERLKIRKEHVDAAKKLMNEFKNVGVTK